MERSVFLPTGFSVATGRRASSRALDEPFHYLQRFFTKSLAGSQPFANSLFKKNSGETGISDLAIR